MHYYYRQFRQYGLTAYQAYTAAYCAVRSQKIVSLSQIREWAYFFVNRPSRQMDDIRFAVSHITPNRIHTP